MEMLKPKSRSSGAQKLLIGMMVMAFAGATALSISRGSLTATTLIEMLLIAALVALIAIWFFSEDKRARSVELSKEGVSALLWQRVFGFIPIRLSPVTIQWREVTRIGRNGFVIFLEDGKKQIAINTYLFEKPDAVIAFINECSAAEAGSRKESINTASE